MSTLASTQQEDAGLSRILDMRKLLLAIRGGVVAGLVMAAVAIVFGSILKPLIASLTVEETVTSTLNGLAMFLLPFVAFITSSSTLRGLARSSRLKAIITALIAMAVIYLLVLGVDYFMGSGPFAPAPTFEFSLEDTEDGVLVTDLVPGGVSEEAGLMVGDVITAIRRDEVDRSTLLKRISQLAPDEPLRLRLMRDGEEMQITIRAVLSTLFDTNALVSNLIIAAIIAVVTLYWPGTLTPYFLLVIFLSPLVAGYLWVIIATFSYRTQGMLPLDGNGNIGGLSFENWQFIVRQEIAGQTFDLWLITLNSLVVALLMTAVVVLVSAMAGYALSRMNFPGRRSFLSFTLILHGFPAVTLIIPIFFVLLYLGNVPVLGDLMGFNTLGGVALVMVAFQLPLGVWLMKGFFDNIPWDMERSALIDGASRWRTFWEIALPQIRPGLLALGIFAFIGGWNAYIIPATYTIGTGASTLPVFLRQLIDETAPVDWNQVAAVGVFQLIPIFLFFIFAQEYLLNIYAGGTKGTS